MGLNAQITVSNALTPQNLVQNVLLGGGITVSNVTFSGGATYRGTFSGTSNIGMTEGLLLTTGDIAVAVGPNDEGSASEGGGTGGDADLTAIVGNTTYDAAVLEFDFIPASDTISFNYVFASEEYPEYVCSEYNDVFAFFLSGQNPLGGNYTNTNIALIPGTSTPVAINSVNSGIAGTSFDASGCTALNYNNYFVDNTSGTTIQYNGFTTVLTATAVVVRCTQYHIKLAIADVGDGAYDSGVFLQARSFSAPSVNVEGVGSTNDSIMVEGCGYAEYTFSRSGGLSNPYAIHYLIGGTATNGVDYQDLGGNPIADSIVFPAGEDTVILDINPVQDGISEPWETITLLIPQLLSCVTDTLKATIYIQNVDPLQVKATGDTTICSQMGESAVITANLTGGYGPFYYAWIPSGGSTPSITVAPEALTEYSVYVTDSCGTSTVGNSIIIRVLCELEVPNVFTPNGDQLNDLFVIKNLDQYPESHLVIYNRWGKNVYESADYKNNWDGGDVAAGTYYYILTRNDETDYHGTVTVLR